MRALVIITLLAGFVWSGRAETDLKGYAKNLLSGSVGDESETAHISRIRLKLDHTFTPSFRGTLHYEQQLLLTDALIPESVNAPPRFLDLEHGLSEQDDLLYSHFLDRLSVTYETEHQALVLGRQPVSWGSGRIWNPVDLFAGFSPTEIDRDDKPGVDVVRWSGYAADDRSFDLVFEPLSESGPYAFDPEDSSLAARAFTRIGEYDLALLGGQVAGDAVIGGDFVGYLKDAGVRGEWIYTFTDESEERNHFRAVLGADYSFPVRWDPYLGVEYFYNGLGTDESTKYIQRSSATSVQRAFQRGNAFNIGRNYLGLSGGLTLSARVRFQTTTLINLNDESVREYAAIVWSVAENVDLLVGAQAGFGSSGTEFEGFFPDPETGAIQDFPDFVFGFLKVYF